MSQTLSNSCKGSIDLVFAESLSKVSISQLHQIQADSSAPLPSLAQIVFGQSPSHLKQVIQENEDTISLVNKIGDASLSSSPKRQASEELQKEMTLSIDDGLAKQERCSFEIDFQSISALPLRTLIWIKGIVMDYANEQGYLIDSKIIERRVYLFAYLLLAAIELKTLSVEQLLGQNELSLFALGQKEIIKYITLLTEETSKAIALNKQSSQSIWQQLVQKIRDPDNKQLRRKFLSLRAIPSHPNISSQEEKLLAISSICSDKGLSDESKYESIQDDNEQISSKVNEVEPDIQLDTASVMNYTVNTSLVVELSLNMQQRSLNFAQIDGQNANLFAQNGGKIQNQGIQECLVEQVSNQEFSESVLPKAVSDELDLSKKMVQLTYAKIQKEISIATEGYLTQIQISFDGINERKEDSELFKSSCMSGFPEGQSVNNISSII